MDIFPFIGTVQKAKTEKLLLYRDILLQGGTPVFSAGEPVMVEGKEAVLSYAVRALRTRRGRYPYFSKQYGSDLENFLGTGWSAETKEAECIRGVRECLMQSPYIEAVENAELTFADGILHISVHIRTVYGDGDIYV